MLKAALAGSVHAAMTRGAFLCTRATDINCVLTIYTGDILAGRFTLRAIGWARGVVEVHRQIRKRRVCRARNDQRRWLRSQESADGERRNCDNRNDCYGPGNPGKSVLAQPAGTIVAPRRADENADSLTPVSTREPLTTLRAKVGTVHRGRFQGSLARGSRPWNHAQDARATFKAASTHEAGNYIRLARRAIGINIC